MSYRFKLAEAWGISPQQSTVIGYLLNRPSKYQSTATLCELLYGKPITPAPAKLRMLIRRCRDIIVDETEDQATIIGKRNSGWKITIKHSMVINRYLA